MQLIANVIKRTLWFLLILVMMPGCKKLVEVNAPVTGTNGFNVFAGDATAAAVLTGLYVKMSYALLSEGNSLTALSLYTGLSSDELDLYGNVTGGYTFYYRNALTNSTVPNFWFNTYPYIFTINSAIEGLAGATNLTPSVRQQLTGEARFMRAFCYFYLVNLYGDIPLATSTDYKINILLARTPQAQVYDQIIADLKEAIALLSPEFVNADAQTATTERVRPTKWAATALLARVYLYTGDFTKSAQLATEVINHSTLFSLTGLNEVFLKNSTEAIWQLQPVSAGWNTQDARVFIIPSTGPGAEWPVYLSSALLGGFEPGDNRRTNWINSVTADGHVYYYPYKYKSATRNDPVTEYATVLRLAEQYLIRAEARAQQGDIEGAISDLDVIRHRAGLSDYKGATDKSSLLTAILNERRVEFFTEWGHRWLDIKRTGTINAIMSITTPAKGGSWSANWQWYPVALEDLQKGPKLVQNTGY